MFAIDSQEHEEKALGQVSERLISRFEERNPAEVRGVVDRVVRRFGGARIREYIPLLVERISRDELSHRSAA
jgi:hypothetical protein